MRELEAIYRAERGRVLASLIRLLGGFELAEEALADAFLAASQQWPRDGIPANPRAWLVSAGRFKAIDRLRQRGRAQAAMPELLRAAEDEEDQMPAEAERASRSAAPALPAGRPPQAGVMPGRDEVRRQTGQMPAEAERASRPAGVARSTRDTLKLPRRR